MTERVTPADPAPRAGGFLRQGVLILLPVVVLAGIGFISLRQDKVLAEREATERAQQLADESADAIWAALTDISRLGPEFSFQVDAAGRLLFPPPVNPLPSPAPLPLGELTPEQRRHWARANAPGASRPEAVTACRELLATSPPARVDAVMRFRLAGLLAAGGGMEEARGLFAEINRLAGTLTGETGLPLGPLAQFKGIELLQPDDPMRHLAVTALRSNALSHPSSITPFLLARASEFQNAPAESKRWQAEWERQELLRSLHAAAFAQLHRVTESNLVIGTPPRFLWFASNDPTETRWLATRGQTEALATTYHCRPALDELLAPPTDHAPGTPTIVMRRRPRPTMQVNLIQTMAFANSVSDPFPAAVLAAQARLPAYLGLTLDVAGRTIISSNHLREVVLTGGAKGAGRQWTTSVPRTAPARIAQARRWDEGIEALRVGVHLVGPEMVYERQRSRSRIFGLLILAAAVTSVLGFVSARRAYLRQQQLSDMKSNFVSSVSHELRAPLASVRLMAENLEHGKVSEPARQREYFRFIVQECRRLGTLIENVLDFARIEQGRKQYDFEPTDAAALVRQTVQLMEPVAAEKSVSLRVELPPDGEPPSAQHPTSHDPGSGPQSGASDELEQARPGSGAPMLDGPAIQQALINLLDNAIKHSPPDSCVTVALSFSLLPSAFCLSVEDHGSGIPREEHERIFERFYRRGPELRRETQGVGIGLSIVKHVVEAHGGRVRVESEVGQGSRFVMELPFTQTPSPKLRTPQKFQVPTTT